MQNGSVCVVDITTGIKSEIFVSKINPMCGSRVTVSNQVPTSFEDLGRNCVTNRDNMLMNDEVKYENVQTGSHIQQKIKLLAKKLPALQTAGCPSRDVERKDIEEDKVKRETEDSDLQDIQDIITREQNNDEARTNFEFSVKRAVDAFSPKNPDDTIDQQQHRTELHLIPKSTFTARRNHVESLLLASRNRALQNSTNTLGSYLYPNGLSPHNVSLRFLEKNRHGPTNQNSPQTNKCENGADTSSVEVNVSFEGGRKSGEPRERHRSGFGVISHCLKRLQNFDFNTVFRLMECTGANVDEFNRAFVDSSIVAIVDAVVSLQVVNARTVLTLGLFGSQENATGASAASCDRGDGLTYQSLLHNLNLHGSLLQWIDYLLKIYENENVCTVQETVYLEKLLLLWGESSLVTFLEPVTNVFKVTIPTHLLEEEKMSFLLESQAVVS